MDARQAPREAQRRRTRLAIVTATQDLLRRGAEPNVDEIAAAAEVSRRTVYLHFPTLDHLLLDATAGMLSGDAVDAAMARADGREGAARSSVAAARARVRALVGVLIDTAADTLPLGRRLIRLTVAATPSAGTRRGYRRVEWVNRAVDPLRPRLDEARTERLISALCVVAGWEAMTVLQDVCGLAVEDQREVLTWMSDVLVEAATRD